MPTSAVALTNLGQIHHWLLGRPGIGSHRDFHAKATLAEAHAVNGLGMKIIRNELVVALEIVVGDVEENSPILALGALLQNVDRHFVTFEQGTKKRSDKRCFQNLLERLDRKQGNQVGYEPLIWRGLDHHGQLHGRRLHFDRGFRVGIQRSVDDIGPMDEIGERPGIKPEPLLCDHGDEARAGLERRIIEFAVALFLLEVRGVGRRQKRALVMIEPPSNFGRTGILEINNGILVAIELSLVE